MPAALSMLLPLILSIAGGKFAPKGMQALSGKAAASGGSLAKLAPMLAKGAGPAGMAASILPFVLPMLMGGGHGEDTDAESVRISSNASQMSELTNMIQQRNMQGTLAPTLEGMGVNLQELM